MGSDGARLVLAAADGDLDAVMGLLQRKVLHPARHAAPAAVSCRSLPECR